MMKLRTSRHHDRLERDYYEQHHHIQPSDRLSPRSIAASDNDAPNPACDDDGHEKPRSLATSKSLRRAMSQKKLLDSLKPATSHRDDPTSPSSNRPRRVPKRSQSSRTLPTSTSHVPATPGAKAKKLLAASAVMFKTPSLFRKTSVAKLFAAVNTHEDNNSKKKDEQATEPEFNVEDNDDDDAVIEAELSDEHELPNSRRSSRDDRKKKDPGSRNRHRSRSGPRRLADPSSRGGGDGLSKSMSGSSRRVPTSRDGNGKDPLSGSSRRIPARSARSKSRRRSATSMGQSSSRRERATGAAIRKETTTTTTTTSKTPHPPRRRLARALSTTATETTTASEEFVPLEGLDQTTVRADHASTASATRKNSTPKQPSRRKPMRRCKSSEESSSSRPLATSCMESDVSATTATTRTSNGSTTANSPTASRDTREGYIKTPPRRKIVQRTKSGIDAPSPLASPMADKSSRRRQVKRSSTAPSTRQSPTTSSPSRTWTPNSRNTNTSPVRRTRTVCTDMPIIMANAVAHVPVASSLATNTQNTTEPCAPVMPRSLSSASLLQSLYKEGDDDHSSVENVNRDNEDTRKGNSTTTTSHDADLKISGHDRRAMADAMLHAAVSKDDSGIVINKRRRAKGVPRRSLSTSHVLGIF